MGNILVSNPSLLAGPATIKAWNSSVQWSLWLHRLPWSGTSSQLWVFYAEWWAPIFLASNLFGPVTPVCSWVQCSLFRVPPGMFTHLQLRSCKGKFWLLRLPSLVLLLDTIGPMDSNGRVLVWKWGAQKSPWFWVNYNDLTTTSLEIMVSKRNHPQMALIQVSEIL